MIKLFRQKSIQLMLFGALLVGYHSLLLAQETTVLRAEQVFILDVTALNAHTVRLNWRIANGYYLYGNKLKIQSITPGVTVGMLQLPPGEKHQDLTFGELEIYREQLTVDAQIINNLESTTNIELMIFFQGCPLQTHDCYPPQRRKVAISLPQVQQTSPDFHAINSPLSQSGGNSIFGKSDLKNQDFLEPDLAFVFSARLINPRLLQVSWQIAEGYYLYRNKFTFALKNGGELGKIELPAGKVQEDPSFGKIEVYRQSIDINLPIQPIPAYKTVVLETSYQGCAEAGLCYPPITKTVDFPIHESEPTTQPLAPITTAVPNETKMSQIPQIVANSNPISGQLMMAFLGSLLIIMAVYMGAVDNFADNTVTMGWQRLRKGLGLILLIYGILLLIGASSGGNDPFKPLQTLMGQHS